jgi:hypothetical protein
MDADEADDLFAEARRQLERLSAAVAQGAETLAALGIYPVSVVHGEADSEASAQLIYGTLTELAEECCRATGSTLPLRRGTNDSTTYFFAGPEASRAALMFTGKADTVAESWWIITPTVNPVYRRAE